jgi:hypothetical protein
VKVSRKWIILGCLFIALLIYVLLTQTGGKGFNTLQLPKLPELKSENVQKIVMERSGSRLVLANVNQEWQIAEPLTFIADKNKVSSLLRTLGELRITNLVSERPEAEADFGLTSQTAVYLTVEEKNGKKIQLTVGQAAKASNQNFVKLPQDTRIYQILGDLNQQLNLTPLEWRSMVIYDISTDLVQKATLNQKGKSDLVLFKEKQAEAKIVGESPKGVTPTPLPMKTFWKAQGHPVPLNEGQVNQFLSTLCRLASTQILDNQAWTGSEPLARITLENSDNSKLVLEILTKAKTPNQYWVRRAGESTIYVINDYQAKNLLKTLKDFQ